MLAELILFIACMSLGVLVTSPAPGTGASGSMGGTTWSRNRFGAYARARTKPVNPNTARQQTMRSLMASLTARWGQTLTDAQRLAWNQYGDNVVMKNRVGQDIHLTGFNHYIRSNSVISDAGSPLVDAGPVIYELPEQDPALAISASAATQDVSVTFDDAFDWLDEDDAFMYVLFGSPQNNQRNFFNGPWRGSLVIEGDGVTPPTTPEDLANVWVMSEGQRIWIQARIGRADGRLSAPFQAQIVVSA